jgi:CYTH domain-containing protein
MAIEIERKFLAIPERLPPLGAGERFVQGYLSDAPEVRFRIAGRRVVLGVKKPLGPGHRIELEFPREDLAESEKGDLCALALWPPLVKVRHRLPHAGLVWEVDVYEGTNAGLVTVEVEIPALDHPIEFPAWVDAEREITSDPAYANISLTRRPYGTWGKGEGGRVKSER